MKIKEFDFLQNSLSGFLPNYEEYIIKDEWCVFFFLSFLIVGKDDFFYFFILGNKHTWEREWDSNIKTYHKLYSKVIITFKGG